MNTFKRLLGESLSILAIFSMILPIRFVAQLLRSIAILLRLYSKIIESIVDRRVLAIVVDESKKLESKK